MTEELLQCIYCDVPPITRGQLISHAWVAHPEAMGPRIVSSSPTDEEEGVLEAAAIMAEVKRQFSQEVLRLVEFGGMRSYDAQHSAQVAFGTRVIEAEARYAIALSHLPGGRS